LSASLASTMEPNSQDPNLKETSVSFLRASQHRVKQILGLLDPARSPNQQPVDVGMQGGLLHSLHNILNPLNDVLGMQAENPQDLSSAIGSTTQRAPSSSRGLDVFIQNATTLSQLTNQLSTSLKDPLPGFPINVSALQLLEQRMNDAPLEPKDQQRVLLRLRKMRRSVLPESSPSKPLNPEPTNTQIRSPLNPIPSQLTFEAISPWIDDLIEPTDKCPPKDACCIAVDAFNAYMDKRCEDESIILRNTQGDRYLAKRRVRARLACWDSSRVEIHVELRDVACVNIQFEWLDSGIQILHTGVSSPNEYLQDQVNLLLPSKFGFYNDISTHLFIHALHRQSQNIRPIEFLCTTLMHVAGLRTLFDPMPALPTTVSAIPSRTAYGSLRKDIKEDFPCPVSWKWCRIAGDPLTTAPQGEWVAFSPHMM